MTEIFQNGMFVFLGAAGLLILLIGALLIGVGLFSLQRRSASRHWPQVPATIEVSEVRPETFSETQMYKPVVSYRYTTPAGTFTSHNLATTGRLYAKPAKAQKIADRYLVGTTVMARYNPDDPGEAMVEPEGLGGGLMFIVFGLLCMIPPAVGGYQAGLSPRAIGLILAIPALVITVLLLRSRSGTAAARAKGLLPPAGEGSDADVAALMARGEKLLAIRLYRELHGSGLKEAKEAVETLDRDARNAAP
ncbi:hypothetical protein JCM30471_16940 [Desulfuromonas carbonis]|uniref:DUF3592 domain-containing protein n=1 Tax=Desulfuromonas sp. DDH964 TaxID=1823759 RepID=UPI00078E6EEF|nr:DUF3592 domain-containing protein [Desulfuromonas sp. DDH964]AMV73292.1 hypothetical protein DBW_2983 [Desulfuromonas sp. DDH964]